MYVPTPPFHLQVLVLEMNQVLLPARLEVQGMNPVSSVTLSLLDSETQVKSPLSPPTHCWAPLLSSLSSISKPLFCSLASPSNSLLTGRSFQLDLLSRLHLWC